MRIFTVGKYNHISNGQRESFKEEVGFEENFDSEDHPDGNSIICSRGMQKKKKILKEKECACVWACVHACLCVYCHGKSRSTEVKFRIGKSIDA